MISLNRDIYYLKSTRGKKTPDYLLTHKGKNIAIEIGGKRTGREQFKGFTPDKKIIAVDTEIMDNTRKPLFLFGFLEK